MTFLKTLVGILIIFSVFSTYLTALQAKITYAYPLKFSIFNFLRNIRDYLHFKKSHLSVILFSCHFDNDFYD